MSVSKIDLIKEIISKDIKILNESEYRNSSENRELERTIFLYQKEAFALGLKKSRNLCNLYELETAKIKDTITIEQYIEAFLKVFNENKQKKSSEILQIFQEKILQCDDYNIISVLYGVSLKNDCNFIDLGDFVLCCVDYFESIKNKDGELFGIDILKEKIINYDFVIENIDNIIKPKVHDVDNRSLLIVKNVKSVDHKSIEKIFNDKLLVFIKYLLYCFECISINNYKIGIKEELGDTNNIISFNLKDGTSIGPTWSSGSLFNSLYAIDDTIFSKNNNNKKIFTLINKVNLNEIEEKIKLALDFIGQAFYTDFEYCYVKNISEQILYLSVGWEILLSDMLEKDNLTYKMSEFTALLIGSSQKERIEINKYCKKLYGHRSSVFHSGEIKELQKSESIEDFYTLLGYVKRIINKYFDLMEEKKFSNFKEILDYLINFKFR